MEQKKVKCAGVITGMRELAPGIFDMKLKAEQIAVGAAAGQFVALYSKDKSRMLPRPISLCEIDKEQGILRLVFRVVGAGTEEFSGCSVGEQIEVMGPLGNGFFLDEEGLPEHPVLIGGGIGIPPMLQTAKELKKRFEAAGIDRKVTVVLGYRDAETFLADDFEAAAEVVIATEDGSIGTKGNVIDAIRANKVAADMLYACGPTPMLRGIKAYAAEQGIRAQISMEERMACGIGACLACVCKSKETDPHTNVNNKRICKDGPVFYAEEVEL